MFGNRKSTAGAHKEAVPHPSGQSLATSPAAETPSGGPHGRRPVQEGAVAFAKIVSLLMRSPHHKHYSLADLEWLVLPPLASGQFCIMEAKAAGSSEIGVPVGVALWASVSPEVDQRLTAITQPGTTLRLRPDEWRSGDILWLIEAVGDQRVMPGLFKQLSETKWKGREVKVRVAQRGVDDRGPQG